MNLVGILIVFGTVIGSMVLHELAHGLVAYWLGDDTAKSEGRLTLNPIKHLDPVLSVLVPVVLYMTGGPIFGGAKPVPVDSRNLKYKEWGMALVALAGPMTNFVLAFIGFLIFHFVPSLAMNPVGEIFLRQLVLMNLGFGIFNLIPIPPLDGSRVLYAIAPDGVRSVMLRMEAVGLIVIYILIASLGSVFSDLMGQAIQVILNFFQLIVSVL